MAEWVDDISTAMIRWIAILPFLAAVSHGLLIGLFRAKLSERSVWAISLTALAASFGLSALAIFDLVSVAKGGAILDTIGPWIGGGVGPRSFSAELTFQFDPLSAVFCLAVTSIALAVYVYTIGLARSGRIDREAGHRTFAMLDLLVGSTLVLVLADNLLLFFLGWTGVGIASQLFASFDYEEKSAARAGATTFVIGRVGDLGLLAAILLLFDGLSRAGASTLSFRGIAAAFRLLEGQGVPWLEGGMFTSPPLLELVGFGLALAALTKCAQLPLHFWLPRAAAAPIPANALMQSSTTMIVGVYLLLRFSFLLNAAPGAMTLLVVMGAATMVLSSLAAATQWQMPRMVAFTTSSLLGFVMLAIGVGAYSGATFLLLTHAFVKAHLILALGIVSVTLKGETDLRRMGGLGHRMRWTQGMVALSVLAFIGIPPLANFFPLEELLAFVHASERADRWILLAVITTSLGILAFALARAYFLIFWGNVRPGGLLESQLHDPAGWRQHSLTALAVMTVAAGMLTPSQFWGDAMGVTQMDSIGHFLSRSIVGAPDPLLAGAERGWLIVWMLASGAIGLGLATWRYASRGYRGEPSGPALRFSVTALREMLFIEKLYDTALVRPLRRASQWALVGGIETKLIDRVVVSGGSGLVRRLVWGGLRRLQNGRLQSYALLGLLTVLVVVSWMVE